MARPNRITNTPTIEPVGSFTPVPSGSGARVRCESIPAAALAFVLAFLLCLGSTTARAQ